MEILDVTVDGIAPEFAFGERGAEASSVAGPNISPAISWRGAPAATRG
jgi:phosphatidylethanolamine-binding protein (PEBP) family uncharacterized protein